MYLIRKNTTIRGQLIYLTFLPYSLISNTTWNGGLFGVKMHMHLLKFEWVKICRWIKLLRASLFSWFYFWHLVIFTPMDVHSMPIRFYSIGAVLCTCLFGSPPHPWCLNLVDGQYLLLNELGYTCSRKKWLLKKKMW